MTILVPSDHPPFWCAHRCSVGSYRRCPIAISPNLSNLQPTVHQITVGIERMHDALACVDMLAVRPHFPHSLVVLPLLFPNVTDVAAVAVGDSSRRLGAGLTLRFRLRLRCPSITVTTVAW